MKQYTLNLSEDLVYRLQELIQEQGVYSEKEKELESLINGIVNKIENDGEQDDEF